MSDEPTKPASYPPPSQATLPYIVQEANPASVIQVGNDVSRNLDDVSCNQDRLVSHDLAVIQNEANDQQKPCITQPAPLRDTNGKACSTGTGTKHYPMATRLQIRKDYTHGLGTLPKLAAKHGIPVNTARTWRKVDNWAAARNRWRAKQMEDDFTPAPPQILPPPSSPAKSPLLSRIEAQLEALDNFLDNANSPEDWQKLTNAKDKLLQNYYVLAGIAKPAARKASRTAPARVQPIEPVEPGIP